ncbi:hypothetical protein RB653_001664 [Dictyostelium firmibasis]|uniref:Uncharacterized protein n=1 Tax=Dictyostelium firmibasis TaxID=79012 RepID=A0AAN7TYW3_9MYCE
MNPHLNILLIARSIFLKESANFPQIISLNIIYLIEFHLIPSMKLTNYLILNQFLILLSNPQQEELYIRM